MAMYGKVSYWDERYRANANQTADWYQDYNSLRHLLNPIYFGAQSTTAAAIKSQQQQFRFEGSCGQQRQAPASASVESVGGEERPRQQVAKQQQRQLDPDEQKLPATAPAPASFPSREKCRVLVLGCGNSGLSEAMYVDGWTGTFVNVDFSSVVIEQMKEKYGDGFYNKIREQQNKRNRATSSSSSASMDDGSSASQARTRSNAAPNRMQFMCADVTKRLPFDDESFDLIICKGTFDAVLCSANPVSNIRRLVEECVRLLSPGHGIFFLVTTGNPDNRIVYLEKDNSIDHYWEGVSIQTVKRPSSSPAGDGVAKAASAAASLSSSTGSTGTKTDYVYICRKCVADYKKVPSSDKSNAGVTSTSSGEENIPWSKNDAGIDTTLQDLGVLKTK